MMLLDYFGFLIGFMDKWMKSANLGNFGVLRRGVGIHATVHAKAWHVHAAAQP